MLNNSCKCLDAKKAIKCKARLARQAHKLKIKMGQVEKGGMPIAGIEMGYKKKRNWILVFPGTHTHTYTRRNQNMIKLGHQTRALVDLIEKCFTSTPRHTAIANLKWNTTSLAYYLISGWRFGILTNFGMLFKTLFSLFFDIVDLTGIPTYAIRARPYQILSMMLTLMIAVGMTVWTNEIRNLVHPYAHARFYLATNVPLLFTMLAYFCIVNLYKLVNAFWHWICYIIYHATVALLGRINPIMLPLYLIVDTGIFAWLWHFIVIVCLKPVATLLFGRRNCMFAIFWSFYDFLQTRHAQHLQPLQPIQPHAGEQDIAG
jgi:hypothetical protein